MARTKQTLINTFLKLKNEALKYGLIVNENKTKYLKCTRKQTQDGKLSVESMQFEQVESFKYLGSVVNKNNTIKEEIKEKIMTGNKAFYTNKRMFQDKLLSKRSKLKLCWSLIRPLFICACETCVLDENVKGNDI
jgi:ubiquitin